MTFSPTTHITSTTHCGVGAVLQSDVHGVIVEADGGRALLQRPSLGEQLGEARLTDVRVAQEHDLEHLRAMSVVLRGAVGGSRYI